MQARVLRPTARTPPAWGCRPGGRASPEPFWPCPSWQGQWRRRAQELERIWSLLWEPLRAPRNHQYFLLRSVSTTPSVLPVVTMLRVRGVILLKITICHAGVRPPTPAPEPGRSPAAVLNAA
jgi:hypothetical protein